MSENARICLNSRQGKYSHLVLTGNWGVGATVKTVKDTPNGLEWTPQLVGDDPLKAAATRLRIQLKCLKGMSRDDGGPTTGDLTITLDPGTGTNTTVIVPDVTYANDGAA